jgi:hypothetical protein
MMGAVRSVATLGCDLLEFILGQVGEVGGVGGSHVVANFENGVGLGCVEGVEV